MSDHKRDVFMWRWSRDRAGGIARALVWGALFGGLFGLFLAFAQNSGGVRLPNPLLWFAPLIAASFGLEFVSSPPLRDTARVLIFGALLALVIVAPNFEMSWRGAIYLSVTAFAGAALAARSFRADEARFRDLLSQGVAVPQRRPMPGWST